MLQAESSYVLFLFGFESGVLDLMVVIPDHCLSIYYVGSISFLSKWRKKFGDAPIHLKEKTSFSSRETNTIHEAAPL